MVTRLNVDLPAGLKARLIEEAKLQRRSYRAIVEMALERYLDDMVERAAREAQRAAELQPTAQS